MPKVMKNDKQTMKLNEAKESAKEEEHAKSSKHNESGTVERIINNLVTSASAACYIGQNGLYQSGTKPDKKKA